MDTERKTQKERQGGSRKVKKGKKVNKVKTEVDGMLKEKAREEIKLRSKEKKNYKFLRDGDPEYVDEEDKK